MQYFKIGIIHACMHGVTLHGKFTLIGNFKLGVAVHVMYHRASHTGHRIQGVNTYSIVLE